MKPIGEPRLIKGVTEKKKKKVYKKTEEGEKPKYTLIVRTSNSKVDELYKLYEIDPYKARVKFFNTGKESFTTTSIILFEFENGDFEICEFRFSYGISTTNRIYSSQKKISFISFKKNKFWYKGPMGTIRPLTYSNLMHFITMNDFGQTDSKTYKKFKDNFHWLQMLSENKLSHHIPFNTIISKKIFGMKDVYRHVMRVPYPVAKKVIEGKVFRRLSGDVKATNKLIKSWYEALKILDHTDQLSVEMLESPYFLDTCKMARTLGRKVNCKWGLTRLKDEHNRWSRDIANILLDCEVEYALRINQVYCNFAKFSGFQMFRTNKELLAEGIMQNHCVGTYIDRIQNGSCAIYHVDGYTLQVGTGESVLPIKKRDIPTAERPFAPTRYERIPTLTIKQFRGKNNDSAPDALHNKVMGIMSKFVDANGLLDKDIEPFEYDENNLPEVNPNYYVAKDKPNNNGFGILNRQDMNDEDELAIHYIDELGDF